MKAKDATYSKDALKSTEWDTIYRFPYIVQARLFSRCKFYLTGFSVICIPVVGWELYAGTMTMSQAWPAVVIPAFSMLLMYGFGQVFRRLIGSVYLSPDQHLVRISHLTFFGNRTEIIVSSDDLVPLCDVNLKLDDYLLQVRRATDLQSSKDMLFICLRYGGILDQDKFEQIFGYV